jgi:hypothetical protein
MAEYVVWCPEEGARGPDEGHVIKDAYDHAEAAELWAEWSDWSGADYRIVGGRFEPVLHVQGPTGEVQRFKVIGEAVPSYNARQLDGETGSP